MELYNKKDDADLHSEGIDLVGSGVREDNEFTEAGEGAGGNDVKSEAVIPAAPVPSVPLVSSVPLVPSATPVPLVPLAFSASPVTPAVSIPKPPSPTRPFTPKSFVPKPFTPKTAPKEIKPIRTYRSDAEEAVRYQNVSAVDIAVAEQNKREATPIEYIGDKKPRGAIFAITIVVLILLLAGGAYYWFQIKPPENDQEGKARATIETLIPYASGSTLVMKGNDPISLIGAKLGEANPGMGSVYALVPTLYATSTTPADVSSVFEATEMPSRLSRSLAPEYMIGSYSFDVNSPFIILKTTFFQNAFAGMLEWEKDMASDLWPLIMIAYPEIGTPSEAVEFSDTVVSNIDTRVLRNADGKTILAYAFADQETVIIAMSESALKHVLNRLLTVRSVQ